MPVTPTRFEDSDSMVIAGLMKHYTPATMNKIPEQWGEFRPYIGNVPTQVDKKTYGVCYNANGGEFDYLSGVQVSSTSSLPSEFTHVEIPAQRYAVFAHREHISKLKETIDGIFRDWAPTGTSRHPAFLERYENFNPETGMGDTEIWVPVTPKD